LATDYFPKLPLGLSTGGRPSTLTNWEMSGSRLACSAVRAVAILLEHAAVETSFDAAYLRRLMERDPHTETHFVRHFARLIRLVVLAHAGSDRLVDDVRQETFLRVFQLLREQGGLERPERLGAFVYSVCRRVLAEHLRQEGLGSCTQEEGGPSYRMLMDELLVSRDRKRRVRALLKELSPLERKALSMVFLEERDRAKVSAELGLTQDYLRVVLCRAKSRLRKSLGSPERISSFKSVGSRRSAVRDETPPPAEITDQ